jgi:NADH-quinone oxidoreductase subunit J
MTVNAIIFYLLAAFILFNAVLAVTSRKIFRSAIWLLFSLIGIAGFYFWIDMQFIAAVQVVVYVGGIVVLIIFSIFLTQQSGKEMPSPVRTRGLISVLAVVAGFILSFYIVRQHNFTRVSSPPLEVSVAEIGTQMLSTTRYGYLLPFEVVSMLLLASMIGCIVIARKE